MIFFDIKKPATYIFQSHLHSVWQPLKMYVDFSSERFSLCILFTFIRHCPAQYFIFIVASGPSWQHGLYEKQNKTSTKSQRVSFWENAKIGEANVAVETGRAPEWKSCLCPVIGLSVVNRAPPPSSTLAKLMWEPSSGSALGLQSGGLKNLGGFCEINN